MKKSKWKKHLKIKLSLFDCFYNACSLEGIKISQNISVPEFPKYGLFDDIEHTKRS